MKGVYRRTSPSETKKRLSELKELQSLPLNEKISISIQIINKSLKLGKSCLLYSGGKDSSVLLKLLLEIDKNILIMHNDTTLGDQQYIDFIRKMTTGLNYIETTASDPVKMWKEKGYYPILSKRGFTKYKKLHNNLRVSPVQCCYQLKEMYCNKVLRDKEIEVVFWGNRAGESNRRKLTFVDNGFLFKPKKYSWYQSYPLQHWTDDDVLTFLKKEFPEYPISKSFEQGCLCCGTDITFKKNTLVRLFMNDREKWEYYMKNGFAEQIAILNGLKTDKEILYRIIKDAPQLLFRAPVKFNL